MKIIYTVVLLFINCSWLVAQVIDAPPNQKPDERYKADILVIVAHPDDETAIFSYLAKAVLDEGKGVAVVFANRGDGGGNEIGGERSTSLGMIREIEAARAGFIRHLQCLVSRRARYAESERRFVFGELATRAGS